MSETSLPPRLFEPEATSEPVDPLLALLQQLATVTGPLTISIRRPGLFIDLVAHQGVEPPAGIQAIAPCDDVQKPPVGEPPFVRGEIAVAILAVLRDANGPLKAVTISSRTGREPESSYVRLVLRKLVRAGEVLRLPGHRYWLASRPLVGQKTPTPHQEPSANVLPTSTPRGVPPIVVPTSATSKPKPSPRQAPLSEIEADVLEALSDSRIPFALETLAARAGYEPDEAFRGCVAGLCRKALAERVPDGFLIVKEGRLALADSQG